VDLSRNNITDFGVRQLADALRKTKSVCHVALSNNPLTGEGVSYLLQALTGNQHITSVELMNRDRGSNKLKFG
jgi:Ran GTPase-activating protein (RanGAP) involved in mRNA processing and transport